MSTIDLKPITLAIALADHDPLFGGPLLAGATCRSCGVSFFGTNGKRLCDECLVERVNGVGELEDDQVPRWASRDARGTWAIVRDYWREEVQIGCKVSLARLERICRERGYDYQATLRALS